MTGIETTKDIIMKQEQQLLIHQLIIYSRKIKNLNKEPNTMAITTYIEVKYLG